MKRDGYAAYSPEEHVRVQLGITERECTPPDDAPGISVRFTITANLVSTNAPVLKVKALDAIARGHVFVAVDLATCPYVTRAGFDVLASIANAARRAGGGLMVENSSTDLVTLFNATGLSKLFTISKPEREAVTP
jgi:anti-anti-sigma factor